MQVMHGLELTGVNKLSSGKVREIFDLGENLLIVATDRLSAFDVVMPDPIPYKGHCLTQLSVFWFELLKGKVNTHFVTANVEEYPVELRKYSDVLRGRSMIVKRAQPFPIECIVRAYLLGSGFKDYQANGSICGIKLPEGLRLADKLPEPLFTPSTKARVGHDENINFDKVVEAVGRNTADELKRLSLEVFNICSKFAALKGIVIADTKFEFGLTKDGIILIDEVCTPDSSRFVRATEMVPGKNPPFLDKQYVRDYLESIRFNKRPPGPRLPEEVIRATSEKYREIVRILTGKEVQAE